MTIYCKSLCHFIKQSDPDLNLTHPLPAARPLFLHTSVTGIHQAVYLNRTCLAARPRKTSGRWWSHGPRPMVSSCPNTRVRRPVPPFVVAAKAGRVDHLYAEPTCLQKAAVTRGACVLPQARNNALSRRTLTLPASGPC